MKKVLLSLVLLFGLMQPAFSEQSWSYSWEDGAGTELGFYGNAILENSTEQAYQGTHSLKITEEPIGDTPQVYIWWVKGLVDGDNIDASFYCYDMTLGSYPSGRIWAHYTSDPEDITSYAGTAGGNSTYSDGTGWSQLPYSWEFDSDGGSRDGFVVEARIYSAEGANVIYVDYAEINISSDTAIIYNAAGNTGGDITPPTLVSANATSSTTVNLIFSEKISQETAEVVGNYNIDKLTVLDANLQTDSITVELTTSEQTEGESYTITVNNVKDLAGNPIEPNSTITFTGFAGDTTPPTITNVQAHSLISVEITFSEALNDTMAENETNYSISPSLEITSAEIHNGNKVLLTTEEQTAGEIYSLTVINIEDLHKNVIVETTVVFIGFQPGEYDLIADIQNNFDDYDGEEVTVCGVVTIGDNLLYPGQTKFYIQDESDRGIQIYNSSSLSTTYVRGDFIEVTGTVDKYNDDVEIKYPTVTLLSQDADLPEAHNLIGNEDTTWNGTWAKAIGEITEVWDADEFGFYQITVNIDGTEIDLMFWNSAVAPDSLQEYAVGDEVKCYGIITFYEEEVQLTCGYEEDISFYSGEEYFEINPITPQPYDTVTVTFTCPDNYTGDCDTVRLLWRTVQHLPFKSIIMNSVEGTYNEFEDVIPGQPEATIVYFYFAVTDTSSGKITNFPENAPYTLESYKYGVASLKAILKVPPRTFCPALNEKFEIQVHSRKDDKIILRLYNSEGKLVYTFFNKLSNGSESFEWDGKDETWNTLPPGLYICHLEVIDRNSGKRKTNAAPIVIATPLKH
ncbi:MAG: hypothetical protein ISS28_06650 [Candidatus Cloacimonetes bacterium]|nr:hypothetical protein [Candidatus Cloacimonadota bacterium]MBL7086758.1 hypothetical protein [Candidatus Cloacimonadota bacterium]